jgi:periplasmic mercuric ion binding protein
MKTFKLFLSILFCLSLSTVVLAQNKVKTEIFTVGGVCDMCKARIENAARLKGVVAATWNIQTHKLTLKYDPAKTNADAVQKAIAAVGHDAGKYKAADKSYNSLSSCCKYR